MKTKILRAEFEEIINVHLRNYSDSMSGEVINFDEWFDGFCSFVVNSEYTVDDLMEKVMKANTPKKY